MLVWLCHVLLLVLVEGQIIVIFKVAQLCLLLGVAELCLVWQRFIHNSIIKLDIIFIRACVPRYVVEELLLLRVNGDVLDTNFFCSNFDIVNTVLLLLQHLADVLSTLLSLLLEQIVLVLVLDLVLGIAEAFPYGLSDHCIVSFELAVSALLSEQVFESLRVLNVINHRGHNKA